jgi:putative cell wall-binding protein
MRFKIPGLRRAGVAAVAAITAGTAFAALGATPAWAAPPPTGNITALAQPTIVAGTTNSAAGAWSVTANAGSFVSGSYILIQVDSPADINNNCSSATDFVAFNTTANPTVNVVSAIPANGTAQGTTSFSSSTAACLANTRKDLLTFTFTNGNSGFPNQTINFSGIAYDSGTSVATGQVVVEAWGCTGAQTVAACMTAGGVEGGYGNSDSFGGGGSSNAVITAVVATANKPPVGLKPASSSQAISNIVLTESEAAAVGTGVVCVRIDAPSGGPGVGTFWDPTSTPTVTATNGGIVNNNNGGANGTSSGVTLSNSTANPIDLTFNVTNATVSPGVYTISGLKVNTGTNTGPVLVDISDGTSGCGNTNVASLLEVASVITLNRIGGADRYGTAAALFSGFAVACSTTAGLNAVLSRGDLFADALAANYLAGALNRNAGEKSLQGTGILLTTPNALPDITLSALRNSGVTDVWITGLTDAVSTAVENQLKATPSYNCGGGTQRLDANGNPRFLHVTRIGGATRYDTAQLLGQSQVSSQVGTADVASESTPNPLRTAVLARGDNFPDALAAGPMAFYGDNVSNWAHDNNDVGNTVLTDDNSIAFGTGAGSQEDAGVIANGFPLFLTTPGSLSPQAQAGLLNEGIQQVIVMGGPAAIVSSVDTTLTGLGMRVVRLAGADRSDTAAKAAAFETGTFADRAGVDTSDGRVKCDTDGAADGDGDQTATSCTKPAGLFYRTDMVNVARGDDAGGGADALSGGPYAAGLVGTNENNTPSFTGFEGPTPILLTLDPNTLGSALGALTGGAVSKVSNDYRSDTPDGGIVLATIFGQTAAISAATATAIQNALT